MIRVKATVDEYFYPRQNARPFMEECLLFTGLQDTIHYSLQCQLIYLSSD